MPKGVPKNGKRRSRKTAAVIPTEPGTVDVAQAMAEDGDLDLVDVQGLDIAWTHHRSRHRVVRATVKLWEAMHDVKVDGDGADAEADDFLEVRESFTKFAAAVQAWAEKR